MTDKSQRRPCAETWLQYGRDLNVRNAEQAFAAIDDEIERMRKRISELESKGSSQ